MKFRLIQALFVAALCWSVSAQANLIFVSTLEDELNADGDCSLREALEAANQNTAVDDCVSGTVGGDTIFILLAGDIELESSLVVTERLDIVGPGRDELNIRSRPNYLVSLIKVDMANTAHDFKLEALTLRDGGVRPSTMATCCGALQLIEGDNFLIKNVAFINNQSLIENEDLKWTGGGAIFAGPLLNSPTANLTVEDSLFEDNQARHGVGGTVGVSGFGGAIFTREFHEGNPVVQRTLPLESLTIKRTEFRNNSSGRGGDAIFVQGDTTVTISDSLFDGNSDPWFNENYSDYGGTVNLRLYLSTFSYVERTSFVSNSTSNLHGAIVLIDGKLSVTNATFHGNSGPAVEVRNSALLNMRHSTMVDNASAALRGVGSPNISLGSSIAWGPGSPFGVCYMDAGATYGSAGYNIDSDGSCSITASDMGSTDPQLLALDTWGDSIDNLDLPTMLPTPGGPAVDGGPTACQGKPAQNLYTDQRNETRPVDGTEGGTALCDIGAVEYQFEQDPEIVRLTVDFQGNAENYGRVVSNKGGLDCTQDCFGNFAAQTQVRLTASTVQNAQFTGWGGACTGTGVCIVTLPQSKTVTATFQNPAPTGPIFSSGFEDP